MDTHLLERYGGPVPRYTSYPTAPHFDRRVSAANYKAWLGRIGAESALSLYLHIPFCAQMCWYCGCHTRVTRRYEPIANYLAILKREIALVSEALTAAPPVRQIHWGGGTPNMLSPEDFCSVTETLRERFRVAENVEMAVEIDPRTATLAHAAAFAEAGVTRVSVGVQDLNDSVQRAINRVQPYAQTAEVIESLRAHGIRSINVDLMYGLPHQTADNLVCTVDLTAGLAPDRVALFGYAHVPWMKTHQRMIDEAALPNAADRMAQASAAAARLETKGYRRIGLDHFCRSDDPMAGAANGATLKRNFQGYTTDPADALIGFGASAISSLPDGHAQNAVPLGRYAEAIGENRLATVRGAPLTADDRLRGAVIERLMCDLHVDLAERSEAHGAGADYFAGELHALHDMGADGLVELEGAEVSVTEAGRPFLRTICAVFDAYFEHGPARHSRAV
jgi:oxygen-independent coproporphyrinogen-3 oxidase